MKRAFACGVLLVALAAMGQPATDLDNPADTIQKFGKPTTDTGANAKTVQFTAASRREITYGKANVRLIYKTATEDFGGVKVRVWHLDKIQDTKTGRAVSAADAARRLKNPKP